MRILHVTTIPLTLNFLRGQIRDMRRRGFAVEVVSSPDEELVKFGVAEGIRTHPVQMSRKISPLADFRSICDLYNVLRKNRTEIVHAHTPKAGLLSMFASLLTGVPVRIYHLHGMPYTAASGWRRALLKAIEIITCRLSHYVFCVSPSLRDQAIEDGICSPNKIRVFGGGSVGGVDSEKTFNPALTGNRTRTRLRTCLGIDNDSRVVGFVGRIVRDKGIRELATVWSQLRDQFSDAHLILAGPVEPQDPVDPDVLRGLSEDPRVHFLGFVEDTSEVYAALDLLVLPTYREGFGNVNIEAASMGVPVVATRIPGCVDSVEDGVTGTLVPPRDTAALGMAIARYLNSPLLRQEHGAAGRSRVTREFRQEVIWESVYREYCRLLAEKGLPTPKMPADRCV